jgi:hypothetical protein
MADQTNPFRNSYFDRFASPSFENGAIATENPRDRKDMIKALKDRHCLLPIHVQHSALVKRIAALSANCPIYRP